MKTLVLLLLAVFLAPGPVRASMPAPVETQLTTPGLNIRNKQVVKPARVLKLLYRAAAGSTLPPTQDIFENGTVSGIVAIVLVGLNVGLWFSNPFWAILATAPLAIAGVILGVMGFIKGVRRRSLLSKILNAAAVLLNLAILIAFIALLTGAS